MNTTFFNTVSARDLFGKMTELPFSKNIDEAKEEAHKVVASGDFIRETQAHGNTNESLESTPAGALLVAEDLANRATVGEQKDRLFFENIRETLAALRPLWRKK